MPRLFLYIMLAVPLLMPTGFCPCHLAEAAEVCAGDHDGDTPDHRNDDPNCPCKMVDAGIRGFRSHDATEVVGPVATPAIIDVADESPCDVAANVCGDDVPIFSTAPRYLAFMTFLV